MGEKEIVNLDNGARLGLIADADLIFDKTTGEIKSLIVTEKNYILDY